MARADAATKSKSDANESKIARNEIKVRRINFQILHNDLQIDSDAAPQALSSQFAGAA